MINISILSFIFILLCVFTLGGTFGIILMALIIGGNKNGRD